MTENKAIKVLGASNEHISMIPVNGIDTLCYSSQMVCALEMAEKALEKQVPKKPLHNGANWYRCPNGCEIHKKTFEKDWYCPKCGQKLDWEGGE